MSINGFGDIISWVTGLFGIMPCAACEKRRKWLNKIFPFRFKTMHDKMFEIQNKLCKTNKMSNSDSVFLHMKHRETIEDFFNVFGDKFENLRNTRDIAFHVLHIDDDVLHCALVPAKYGKKFNISKKEIINMKTSIRDDIIDNTKFKKVRWHI